MCWAANQFFFGFRIDSTHDLVAIDSDDEFQLSGLGNETDDSTAKMKTASLPPDIFFLFSYVVVATVFSDHGLWALDYLITVVAH